MSSKAPFAALLVMMIAGAALGQSEFGSVSGGQIEVLTKGARPFSGSVGMTTSAGRQGYEATLGGTLLEDRLWFFGAASILPQTPQRASVGAIDMKMDAQLGGRNSVAAAFSDMQPASFLSLRYTGIVSSNLFFNASFMRRSAPTQQFP